jgi:glutathione S-transferase
MNLTFYYAPMSTATMTDLVLEELGLSCKRVKMDLKAGDTKKPDFLKINPNGKVPVLVHDDIPIWESAAITMYLGEMFGAEKGLYPKPGPRRGEAMKWITWANVTLGDAVYRWARNTQEWVPAEQRNAKAGEAAQADMMNCLKMLNQALAGKKFLLGADYTLADTHVNSFTDWLRHMHIDMSSLSNVNEWGKRCCARLAYAKVMKAEGN